MNFELNENQRLIQEMSRRYAQEKIEPIASEIDNTASFPSKIIKEMGEMGFLGMIVPEEYKGAGLDFTSLAIAVEEISKTSASVGVIMAVNNLSTYTILTFGNEEQKRKYLPLLARGKVIGAFALTEPNVGSDPAHLETEIKDKGDYFLLNGTKRFITNGGEAEIFIAFATIDKEKEHKGICTLIVEKDTIGLKIGKHENLMGIRGTANCEIIFEDCQVPKENILGGIGEGFKIAMHSLDVSRIDIGAQGVGIAQAAFEKALTYSKERKQFGKYLYEFEMIQEMLADMATKIQAARLLVYYAAFLKDKGVSQFSKESSMAKYFASQVAVEATRLAVQIHGGYGYTKDYAVERYYRDAKCMEIYEGTSEIQKIVIARNLTK